MELISLVVGVGLGFVASRLIGEKKPEVSIASPPMESPGKIEPQPQIEPVQPPVVGEKLEPQPQIEPVQPPVVEEKLEPLEELKQTQLAYEMAKQVSSFKSGFLARASHELRSPLTSLIGMHQLILSDLCDSPEEEREFIAQANVSALKMVKLLTDVIDVSKIEDGKARLEITALPLSKVFENLQTMTYMQAAHSNLPFKIIAPEPEIYVLADPRRLQQVLVAIVDTAISRMESGRIQVSAASATDSQQAQIWIDVESPSQIWSEMADSLEQTPEPLDKGGKTSEMSPGLNLLVAQTIVEVMQGRLELVAVSEQTATGDDVIRLQCSLPLATPESVAPVSA